MRRVTVAGGMESDDDSDLDDIGFPDSGNSTSSVKQSYPTENSNAIQFEASKTQIETERATKLFVGRLPEGCTADELTDLFKKYGSVVDAVALKGYGFVRMSTTEEANDAINGLNNSYLRCSCLNVKFANNNYGGSHQRPESRHFNQQGKRSRGVSYLRQKPQNFSSRETEPQNNYSPRHKMQTFAVNHNGPRQALESESSELLDDLRYAITSGNLETTKDILSKGIWIDTILKAGWTGLMYASSSGHADIVQYFLENKADPNYHRDMYTPLMAVCAARKTEEDLLNCCTLLLKHGANVNAHERHLTTPLMFAAREGYSSIVKELLNHGAHLNSQDNRGKTALALAASGGHGQLIRLLIEKGADPTVCDNLGLSPEDFAYENGHNEIVSILNKSKSQQQTTEVETSSNSIVKANGTVGNSHMSIKPKTYSKVGELELFLSGIGFSELAEVFQKQDLNFHDLLIMDEDELEKVGIHQVGVRKKILEACKSVHKKEWQTTSLPNLKQRQYITCPDAVSMMANIAKHLKFISSSVIFIRQQIQSQPRILELAQDSANVHDLIDEMEDSLKNVRFLNDEMRFLKLHLEKIQDRVQYIPADVIVETVLTSSERKVLYVTISIVTTAAIGLCVGLFWKNPSLFSSIPTSVRLKLPFFK